MTSQERALLIALAEAVKVGLTGKRLKVQRQQLQACIDDIEQADSPKAADAHDDGAGNTELPDRHGS